MDIYIVLKIIIFFALALVFFINIWWVIVTFTKNAYQGLAALLSWMVGYIFYLLFKLLEQDLQMAAKSRLSDFFSSQEGRILLALFCLFIGWFFAYLYTSKPLKERSPLQSAFLLLFLSLVHSGLLDSFLTLLKADRGSFNHILPSISFTLALAMTFIYKLALHHGADDYDEISDGYRPPVSSSTPPSPHETRPPGDVAPPAAGDGGNQAAEPEPFPFLDEEK